MKVEAYMRETKGEREAPLQKAIIPDRPHARQLKCELQYSKQKGYNHMSG